jgi:transcriptional regulator with XRE-family HTH domain
VFSRVFRVSPIITHSERGETLPDITMLMPLASYFNVSVDVLMGYDEAQVQEELKKRYETYTQLMGKGNHKEAEALVTETRREFPNDFGVAMVYMNCFDGGRADERTELLLSYADEFLPLCERILNECTVNSIRFNATHIMAKIYKARGEYDKVVACFDDFPSWYEAKNQFLEQLHEKYTEGFTRQVNANMRELLEFAFNKVGKAIWYTRESAEKRMDASQAVISAIEGYIEATGYTQGYSLIAAVYHEGGKVLNAEGYYAEACVYYEGYLACTKRVNPDVSAVLAWLENNPAFETLRGREEFRLLFS